MKQRLDVKRRGSEHDIPPPLLTSIQRTTAMQRTPAKREHTPTTSCGRLRTSACCSCLICEGFGRSCTSVWGLGQTRGEGPGLQHLADFVGRGS